MSFESELKFEKELVDQLRLRGWSSEVIYNPTEEDLIRNWANILYKNNRQSYALGNSPLTDNEMKQLIDKVKHASPYQINKFVNGKTITLKRDDDPSLENAGKEISLKIYDRNEIAAGNSTYQIVRQPKFRIDNPLRSDRRGDVMLLINGMPLIHIELKRSGVSLTEATNQIQKYKAEQCFTGLFNMIQVFVAMTPEEMVYFANPGDAPFNDKFFFHYADKDNNVINDWNTICTIFLNIPMAHELIGYYTVAESNGIDRSNGTLKVLRSYQIYAARAIADRVNKINREQLWGSGIKGGYIWHTTGSGKTLTSFKTAQLIANSGDADKVVFIVDRNELATQSLNEYRNFAEDNETVQNTDSTALLLTRLKSNSVNDSLIVTSIQKMNLIDGEFKSEHDLEMINKKNIVFIFDECHRSTFGDMFAKIKKLFKNAIFFGFTGTPIFEQNAKADNTTNDIFGMPLHIYSIVNGIVDKNVLGFDYRPVITLDYKALREKIALQKANCNSVQEALADPKTEGTFLFYNDVKKFPNDSDGLESHIPESQYSLTWEEEAQNHNTHKDMVVKDILSGWEVLSVNYTYSAILAVSSIPEAIIYYRLFKLRMQENPNYPQIKITALFDPNIDNINVERSLLKEDGKEEILGDYNKNYAQSFNVTDWDRFKKDVANRLAHKSPYMGIPKDPQKRLDLLIVVDQMLTGYDSKYINTLYLDKVLEYSNLIQAFSRTNRIETVKKEYGIIKVYKKPYTMKKNIDAAFELYSGNTNNAHMAYADKLGTNIAQANAIYQEIQALFNSEGIENFEKNPATIVAKVQFANKFNLLWKRIQSAILQGFNWEKVTHYTEFDDELGMIKKEVSCELDFQTYRVLLRRYEELKEIAKKEYSRTFSNPYDVDSTIIEMDSVRIDKEYLEEKFANWTSVLKEENVDKTLVANKLQELQSAFATLPQEEQKIARWLIYEIETQKLIPDPNKTFRDYINERKVTTKNQNIHNFALAFGIPETELATYIGYNYDSENYNDFSRFDALVDKVDRNKAKEFLENENQSIINARNLFPKIKLRLKDFVLNKEYEKND
ncbi:type I restriction endonuclease subunit R [Mycoplasma sp. 2634B]|uniref:type I restriction endonuclease subunit R n=1 Tax=Mycoplasma sp. 2634B TaxID=3401692 RepID=UPI003AAB9DBD